MNIITQSIPRLDPEDIPGSFRRMSDYLREVMETIDFTLGKYAGSLREVDAEGVQAVFDGFRAEFVVFQRDVVSLDNRATAMERRMEAAETAAEALTGRVSAEETALQALTDRVSEMEAAVQELAGRMSAAEGAAAALEERVAALEQAAGQV